MQKHVSDVVEGSAVHASKRKILIGLCLLMAIVGIALAVLLPSSKFRSFEVPLSFNSLKLVALLDEISSGNKLAGPTTVNDFRATVSSDQLEEMSFSLVTQEQEGVFTLVYAHFNREAVPQEGIRTSKSTGHQWVQFDQSIAASQLFVKLEQVQKWLNQQQLGRYSITAHGQKLIFDLQADYYQLTDARVVPLAHPLTEPSYAVIIDGAIGELQSVIYLDE
ncbi:hypothetical protein [Paenibacillus paeoniae]|uniref:hypothetical protein n=1 Tax=Paenibacillus paeoniae TaxID=2292705 RepID=UPI00105894EA|nr:hypothetical protein [Paenibacillus paeoniae]